MKAVTWLKHNALAIVLVAGVLGGGGVAIHDAAARAENSREAAITAVKSQRLGCVRASERSAIVAAFEREAAKARAAAGDAAVAVTYNGASNGIIAQIPAPSGHENDPRLAQVSLTFKAGAAGKKPVPLLSLTPYARALQREGCIQANPIPTEN